MQKHMICMFLVFLEVVPCMAGSYKASEVFPTGFGSTIHTMSAEEKEIAAAFRSALLHLGELAEPLVCERLIDPHQFEISRPSWTTIDALARFDIVKLASRLAHSHADELLTAEGEKNLREAVASRPIQLSITSVPILPNGEIAELLRVQFSSCAPERMEGAVTSFFIVPDGDLTKLRLIKGLGNPTDVFIYRTQAYFDSHSYREVDDSFKNKLPKPQSEILLHSMMPRERGEYHVTRARLLYWDQELMSILPGSMKKK